MSEDTNTGHRIPADLLPSDAAAGEWTPRPAPEPSHAERARSIVAQASRGSLSTIALDPPGYPFGSVVNLATDDLGRPLTFVSTMAEHTRNLAADPRASILIAEEPPEGADPLASGRVTLVGTMMRVERESADYARVRGRFLAANPQAFYVDYGDFDCYRLDPVALRYVGGFGRMSWVDAGAYRAASPDPIAPGAGEAIAHMNADHADALVACAQVFGGVPSTTDASMTALDRYGFDMVVATPQGRRAVRVGFEEPLDDPDQVRPAMVALVRRARAEVETHNG